MKITFRSSRTAAFVSVLLALPFTILFLLFVFNVDPLFGPLDPLLRGDVDRPNVLGTAIVLGAWLLTLGAFIISLLPIAWAVRSGKDATAVPVNLLIAGGTLLLVLLFLAGIIVDQVPCWIGVPNCD